MPFGLDETAHLWVVHATIHVDQFERIQMFVAGEARGGGGRRVAGDRGAPVVAVSSVAVAVEAQAFLQGAAFVDERERERTG